MAAFDAHTKQVWSTAATGTWSHTTGSSLTNAAAMVLLVNRKASAPDTPTCTWGGVAMTQVGTFTNSGQLRGTIFKKASISAGATTVAPNFTNTQLGWIGWSITCSGVDQTTIISDFVSANASASTAVTVTPTNTGASDIVCDLAISDTSGAGFSAMGANQVVGPLGTGGTGWDNTGAQGDAAGSRQPGSAANDPMSWTVTSGNWTTVAARFIDAGVVASHVMLSLSGVG